MFELLLLYWYVPVIVVALGAILYYIPEAFFTVVQIILTICTAGKFGDGGSSGGGGSDGDF